MKVEEGTMQVPFVDLKLQYRNLRTDMMTVMDDVCSGARFILGPELQQFEKNFAQFVGAQYAIGVSTGTDAIMMSLKAVGVNAGDEVISVANTFIATILAISACGAKPVLVDCDPLYYNIDPEKIERAITRQTKAIVPVHLYGQPANMDPIMEIAKKHNLKVIEDACQSHGAQYHGKTTGTIGEAGCFSFFPGKNLGGYGDGGGVVTNDPAIAEAIQMMRNYGQKVKYHHLMKGWNFRLDNLQAGILNVKLKHLAQWSAGRYDAAQKYTRQLKELGDRVITPAEMPNSTHVYHLYIIRVKERDSLQKFLKEKGVETGIHYPIPIHLSPAYADLGYKKGDFPVTERYADEVLSLPMFAEITDEQINFVVESIKEFYKNH